MSAVTRLSTREPQPYVHKLRLEERDGATIGLKPASTWSDLGLRIVGRLVGASLVTWLVVLLGLELAS